MREQLLKLAGRNVTVFLTKYGTVKCQVWGTLKYDGESFWKVSRVYEWDSSVTFHEADIEKVEKDNIHLR